MKRLLLILITISCLLPARSQSNDVHVKHFGEADGFSHDIVSFAIQDGYGYVWIGTWNGLCRYDGYQFKNYRMRPGDRSPLRTNRITSIRELPDHNLECTTTDSMTFVFNRQSERFEKSSGDYSRHPRPFKPDAVTEAKVKSLPEFADVYSCVMLVDRQGGIWVDTHSGLYRIWFGSKPLRPVKSADVAEQEVHGLYADKKSRIWVADKNGYLRVGDSYLTADGRLSDTPAIFGHKVYCIFEDSQGNIWLGAKPDGLTRLKPKTDGSSYAVKHFVHDDANPYSLNCNSIYDIAEDKQGRLWIATYNGGLNMYDLHAQRDIFIHRGNKLKGWPSDENSNKARCIYITPQQVLVVGTQYGLYTCKLDKEPEKMVFRHHYRHADDATSLSNNGVLDLEPTDANTVAIATSGGGICLADEQDLDDDNTRFTTFTTDQGLPSDMCHSLLNVPGDALYVVSQASICRISLRDTIFTNYIRGTLGDDFKLLDTKPVANAEGHLLFGTTQGVLNVSSKDLQKSTYKPPIVFEGPESISLSPDERTLTIRFAALDYNCNVPITYAYRIEGMNDHWTYITDNYITLPDISAGTFKLHLRSTNGDGVWTDNEQTLTIHRRAAFHETPWAWMLYGLLLTLLVIGIYRVVRYIRRLQNEIKDIRLTSNQRIEVMSERIRELLSIKEAVEKVELVEVVESEEDRLFAERVKTFVTAHLGDSNLSMQDFAQAMAISRTLLFARMKSVFNTSPNNYLLNQRIERAKELLRQPDVYVADVAYRSGFSDPKYFSKCFKKLTGMTPTEFQKS